jgi:hypothetical protein
MPAVDPREAPRDIPPGYVAVSVHAAQAGAPLRICALVREVADEVAGRLVALRRIPDGVAYLGCVCDASGAVQQWVEIGVQEAGDSPSLLPEIRPVRNNLDLDDRWRRACATMKNLEERLAVVTEWETVHPLPIYLDVANRQPVHPVDETTGRPWGLCQDDQVLEAAGLPKFSRSLHRYLYQPEGDGKAFVPVTPDAPGTPATQNSVLAAGKSDLVAFNPGGGLLSVRAYSPIGYEAFSDMLSGESPAPLLHGRSALNLEETAAGGDGLSDGWLFLTAVHGRPARLLEAFHLKLRLLSDAVRAVVGWTVSQRMPLLNLSPESFQVRCGGGGRGLPLFWTARTILAVPGDAVEMAVPGSDERFALPASGVVPSVYRPPTIAAAFRGIGTLLLAKAQVDSAGAMMLEGLLQTHEMLHPDRNDLVRLSLNLGTGAAELFVRIENRGRAAAGEWAVRGIGQTLMPELARQLTSAAGIPLSNTTFTFIPRQSSPLDLYSLGVLAVRTLLVNPRTTSLPETLADLFSLASEASLEKSRQPQADLPARIGAVLERKGDWSEKLGPHRLLVEAAGETSGQWDGVPRELWCRALAMIVAMFPGRPDSLCADFGDCPPGGPHHIFERTVRALEELLARSRSLIVVDWRFNREVNSLIRQYATGVSGR